jgi:hypothetical protein
MRVGSRSDVRGRGAVAVLVPLGAFALAALTAQGFAAAQVVDTTYSGNDCVYETNPARLSMTYSSALGALSSTSVHCPVLHTNPTYKHALAEIIFGPPAQTAKVECFLNSPSAAGSGNGGSIVSDWVFQGGGYSIYLDLSMTLGLSESSTWSAMNDDANAQWRNVSIVCDQTSNVPVLGYEVTEWQ